MPDSKSKGKGGSNGNDDGDDDNDDDDDGDNEENDDGNDNSDKGMMHVSSKSKEGKDLIPRATMMVMKMTTVMKTTTMR